MRTRHLYALCVVVLALTTTYPLLGEVPVGVSPGSPHGFVSTTGRCPMFSWGAVDDAKRYEVLVFEMGEEAFDTAAITSLEPELLADPVLRADIPGSATSWTPDRELCLPAFGRYAWVVGAVKAEGTEWSAPRLFRAEIGELEHSEMERMVERVLERLLTEGRIAELQSLLGGEGTVSEVPNPSNVVAPETSTPSATGDAAIRGELAETTTEVYGVLGVTNSEGAGAAGVLGEATSAAGDTAGVRGINQSTDGAAGVFENPAGGPLLKGVGTGGESLLVDGTGAITANAFILSCESAETFFRDNDEDTFGDSTRNAQACAAPSGYVTDGTDCDDAEVAVNPGAAEAEGTAACSDGIDNDCDDLIDELDGDCCGGALNTYYRDADLDSYGDPSDSVTTCGVTPPSGYVDNDFDCNDEDKFIQPDATEICDGVDNDCDGQIDEANPGGGAACDTGLPGVCAAGTSDCQAGTLVCVQDVAASAEVCDGLDNNCDGTTDEGNPDGGASCSTGIPGVCAAGTEICIAGSITCQQNAQASPESCDGLDNDCNGAVDEGGDTLCNDGNGCTDDACDVGQCFHVAASCDDGLTCTVDLCESTGDVTFTCTNVTIGSDAVCNGQCVDTDADVNNCGDCNVSCFDGNECTADTCNARVCDNPNLAAGTPCTGGECDGQGHCVGG